MPELEGEFTAHITNATFDGVPEDCEVLIFFPSMAKPIKAKLKNMTISQPKPLAFSGKLILPQGLTWKTAPIEWATKTDPGEFSISSLWQDMSLQVGFGKPSGINGKSVVDSLMAAIPGLKDIRTRCPACSPDTALGAGVYDTDLVNVIAHLNDRHGWSREEIADWLDTKDWDLQFATPEGETA